MRSKNLDALPAELLDIIASFLDVHDIASLRLADRSISQKASHGHFRSYFSKKTIHLNINSLAEFNKILRPNSLVCSLKDATITGTVSIGIPEQSLVEKLLTSAFLELKRWGPGLHSLDFNIVNDIVVNQGYWDQVNWDELDSQNSALQRGLLKATILALQESGLPVRNLNIFGNLLDHCVPINCIREFPDLTRLKPVFEKLKTFSLCLTSAPDNADSPPEAPKENMSAVARFLGSMPSLSTLDLRWY